MIKHKDTQKYNLPSKLNIVRNAQFQIRDQVTFDENGVCSACNYSKFKKTKINWDERDSELKVMR